MDDNRTQKSGSSFWTTLPGILTGVAGILTAISGLIVALNQVGLFEGSPEDRTINPPSPPSVSIAGRWNGTVRTAAGRTVEIDVFIDSDCKTGKVCGTAKSSAGCSGKLVLKSDEGRSFSFLYRDLEGPKPCSNLSGANIQLVLNGSLSWRLRNISESGKHIATDGVLRRIADM